MDDYDLAAQRASRAVTLTFSSSFGSACKLFERSVRADIYNIYGLVRIADEIVDSYAGSDARRQLLALQREVQAARQRAFSSNIIVHAFQLTARRHGLDEALTEAFFASMLLDCHPSAYTPADYERYIYGSAEAVGLLCLGVFCGHDQACYEQLALGARALGAAFQKVNFLRDLAADWQQLGRYYFPVGTFEQFDEAIKLQIVADIERDFAVARSALEKLPAAARPAVAAADRYYRHLLAKLAATPAEVLKQQRIRLPKARKLVLLGTTLAGQSLRKRRV